MSERLYRIWKQMEHRCYHDNDKSYKHYGGKGIGICEEWLSDFNVFKDWSLKNEYNDSLTIDRIESNGNYEPTNCRWVTMKSQANNKSNNKILEYKGKTQTLAEWADELGFSYHTIKARINVLDMTIEDAFEKPKQWKEQKYGEGVEKIKGKICLTYQNKTLTLAEWIKEINWDGNTETLAMRARKGQSAEQILTTPRDLKMVRNSIVCEVK